MLLFTPETEKLLQTFALTHDLQAVNGYVMWQRAALPTAGGVHEQPARVMEELAFTCRMRNALLERRRKTAGDGE